MSNEVESLKINLLPWCHIIQDALYSVRVQTFDMTSQSSIERVDVEPDVPGPPCLQLLPVHVLLLLGVRHAAAAFVVVVVVSAVRNCRPLL